MQQSQEPALNVVEWGDMDKVLVGMLNKRQGDRRKGRQNHGRAWTVGFAVGIRGRDARERLGGVGQGLTEDRAKEG